MPPVVAGRHTASPDGDVTVFLIGMRFNRPLRIDRWLPIVAAMPRMLIHLDRHPEVGLLGYHQWFGRTTIILSYWRSPEHLQRFASDADAPHLEPWHRFQRRAAADSGVGVWHETYVTSPGAREVIYADMPVFGLAAATGSVPISAGSQTAKRRLAAT